MLVELDTFSGRPNPRWRLGGQDRAELLRREAGLARSASAPPPPPGLGYRGFLYGEGPARRRAGLGYVETPDAVLADPRFSVELFLLDRMPPQLAGLRSMVADGLRDAGARLER